MSADDQSIYCKSDTKSYFLIDHIDHRWGDKVDYYSNAVIAIVEDGDWIYLGYLQ